MNSETTKVTPKTPKEYLDLVKEPEKLDLVKIWVGTRYALFERPVAQILKRRGLIYNWEDLEVKQ